MNINNIYRCVSCSSNNLAELLCLKNQYVTNKYFDEVKNLKNQFKHDIRIAICIECSLIQQINPFPVSKLKPLNKWAIKYSEPEDHLDNLATSVEKLLNNKKNSKILGLSYKDESFINRMHQRGYKKSYTLHAQNDFSLIGISGVEAVQNIFSHKSKQILDKYGPQDFIIVRHLLEHVYDLKKFSAALVSLLSPNGMVLFEVPGCDKAIEFLDYTTIWEEHIEYFTEFSFRNTLSSINFSPISYSVAKYPLEDSLIAICRSESEARNPLDEDNLKVEIRKALVFGNKFIYQKKIVHSLLKKSDLNIIFGAGHLSTCFINYFKLKQYFKFIIDDDKHKNDKYISGAGLPIYHSDKLKDIKNIKCFLGLNPRNEEKVIEKNHYITKNGGKFYSIFPSSKYWMNSN